MGLRHKIRRQTPGAVKILEFYRLSGGAIRQRLAGEPIADLAPTLEASLPAWEAHYTRHQSALRVQSPVLARWCLRWGVDVPQWLRAALPEGELDGLQQFAENVFHVPTPRWLTQAIAAAPPPLATVN